MCNFVHCVFFYLQQNCNFTNIPDAHHDSTWAMSDRDSSQTQSYNTLSQLTEIEFTTLSTQSNCAIVQSCSLKGTTTNSPHTCHHPGRTSSSPPPHFHFSFSIFHIYPYFKELSNNVDWYCSTFSYRLKSIFCRAIVLTAIWKLLFA